MKDEIIAARLRAFRLARDHSQSPLTLRDNLDEACEIIEGLVYQLGKARAQRDEAQNLCKVYSDIAEQQRLELEGR